MQKFGIAETFTSLQGEGLYTGTRMHFIRFAGCSVGKKLTEAEHFKFQALEKEPLPLYREKCTLYDGRNFLCDTNFQTSKAMDIPELLDEIPPDVRRVCFTGGEPLDRNLVPLIENILENTGMTIHIETSGTKEVPQILYKPENGGGERVWLTVAPKAGVFSHVLALANEVKLLVDKDFNPHNLPPVILEHPLVWLQPVNCEWEVDQENIQRCINWFKMFPNWRMSTQMHKIWKVR